MGLVNRLVESGEARAAAERLAQELAALPQTCLRGDLAAAREQWGLPEPEALAVEWRHGMRSLAAGALDGARRFAEGAGRHGAPQTHRYQHDLRRCGTAQRRDGARAGLACLIAFPRPLAIPPAVITL